MLSQTVGPMPSSPSAIARLRLLIETSGPAYEDWSRSIITRTVLEALDEAYKGCAPLPGLQPTDYAHAAGEITGWTRALIAVRDAEEFLRHKGLAIGPKPEPLGQPTYSAPEPPPANNGEKEERT